MEFLINVGYTFSEKGCSKKIKKKKKGCARLEAPPIHTGLALNSRWFLGRSTLGSQFMRRGRFNIKRPVPGLCILSTVEEEQSEKGLSTTVIQKQRAPPGAISKPRLPLLPSRAQGRALFDKSCI